MTTRFSGDGINKFKFFNDVLNSFFRMGGLNSAIGHRHQQRSRRHQQRSQKTTEIGTNSALNNCP